MYPPKTYVDNIGFDGSGTHGWRSVDSLTPEARVWTGRCSYPDKIQVDDAQFSAIKKMMRKLNPGLLAYLHIMMKKILARF